MGSATSRGRPPERAWLVRIRCGDSYVIVNTGLQRRAADRLAEQLTDLLTHKSTEALDRYDRGMSRRGGPGGHLRSYLTFREVSSYT